MESSIIKKLNSSDYSIATNCLDEILNNGKIDLDDLKTLLSLSNTLIIGDLLEKYKEFDETDLSFIEAYINSNLDHPDRVFVSDLIEFATTWGLSLPYNKCLEFLGKYGEEDDYVLLASIDYVFENLRFADIDKIYKLLNSILHNPESNQSAQVKAVFVLFRITNKKEFLVDLIDLVVNGDENNKLLLNNILSLNYNCRLYFEYHDILEAIATTSS